MTKIKQKAKDPLLEYFLHKHKAEIWEDLQMYGDEIRVLETFPNDQIMDFMELVNSNIAVALLARYNTKLIDYIKEDLEWEKLKVDPKELGKKNKQPKKKK